MTLSLISQWRFAILSFEGRSMMIKSAWFIAILLAIALNAPARSWAAPRCLTWRLPHRPPLPSLPRQPPRLRPNSPPKTEKPRHAVTARRSWRAISARHGADHSPASRGIIPKSALVRSKAPILLEAAIQMNPVEPRFLRLLAYWREQLGETDKAIAGLEPYRIADSAAWMTASPRQI